MSDSGNALALQVGNNLLRSSGGASATTGTTLDQLVTAFRRTRQAPIDRIDQRTQQLNQSTVFFNSLRTSLKSAVDAASSFVDPTSSLTRFQTRTATSSDATIATVSAGSSAIPGQSVSVRVDRLATNDSLASQRFTSLTSKDEAFNDKKPLNFTVNGVSSRVTVDLTSVTTNEGALNAIASAVNTQSTIVTASFVRDSSTTGRLVFASKDLGADNRIVLDTQTSSSSLVRALGFQGLRQNSPNDPPPPPASPGSPPPPERDTFTATRAGFAQATSANLSAQVQVNGIVVNSSSNTIENAVQGTSITIRKAQQANEAPVSVTTATDPTALANNVRSLVDTYNAALRSLSDPRGTRETAISAMRFNLRQAATSQLVTQGTAQVLADVGIRFDDDGILKVTDNTRFQNAVNTNTQDVANLFSVFSSRIQNVLNPSLSDTGTLRTRSQQVQAELTTLRTRKTTTQRGIDTQADAFRRQYQNLIEAQSRAQSQFSSFTRTA